MQNPRLTPQSDPKQALALCRRYPLEHLRNIPKADVYHAYDLIPLETPKFQITWVYAGRSTHAALGMRRSDVAYSIQYLTDENSTRQPVHSTNTPGNTG